MRFPVKHELDVTHIFARARGAVEVWAHYHENGEWKTVKFEVSEHHAPKIRERLVLTIEKSK